MAEEMKAATLRRCHSPEVLVMVSELVKQIHASLDGANIAIFWAIDKPLSFWGRAKAASEETWHLTGGDGAGADVILHVNSQLWRALTEHGRKFLLDHLLSHVRAKESGQTAMEVEPGVVRRLYEKVETTLGLDPNVCARHPEGLRQIDEVKRLWKALAEPAQFVIDFAKAEPAPEPVYAYMRLELPNLGPSAVKFLETDGGARPMGVHFFSEEPAEGVDLSTLAYETDPTIMESVDVAIAALKESDAQAGGEDQRNAVGDESGAETSDEPTAATERELPPVRHLAVA